MNILSKNNKAVVLTIWMICLINPGCKKFVEVDPPIDSITTELAFDTDAKTASVIRSLYMSMVKTTNSALGGAMSVGAGVSSDEIIASSTGSSYNEFYINAVNAANTAVMSYYWAPFYNIIYIANAVIENAPKSKGMTDAGKKQSVAEARFVRAACYFYLVNLFGEVPLVTGTDYQVNRVLPRTTVDRVYTLIIEDLKHAEINLTADYPGTGTATPNPARLRANKYAATALLARVYLYRNDWTNAAQKATEVITATNAAGAALYDLEPVLNNVFLIGSKEVVLQLQQSSTLLYTWEGYLFQPASATSIPGYQIADTLSKSFTAGDLRRTNWIGTTSVINGKAYLYPSKYKLRSGTGSTKTESLVFLRLSEVYLVRAEASAQLNELSTAIEDLDIIRKRAGLTVPTPANTGQPELLGLIARERFLELFAELGHRWFDLKRRGEADEVLKNKPNWRPEAKLFPIPADEIKTNPLLDQNPGYSN
jgi:hypothetical protein